MHKPNEKHPAPEMQAPERDADGSPGKPIDNALPVLKRVQKCLAAFQAPPGKSVKPFAFFADLFQGVCRCLVELGIALMAISLPTTLLVAVFVLAYLILHR